MRRSQYNITLIVICYLLGLVSCKPSIQSPQDNKLKALLLKRTFENKNRYLILNDADSISTITHPQAIYVHSNCWVQSADEVINNPPEDSLSYLDIIVDDLSVDVINNTGIVHGFGQFVGLYKQDTFKLELCFVETYVYEHDTWKLIARQAAKK